jgi:hypothetical protein
MIYPITWNGYLAIPLAPKKENNKTEIISENI